MRSCRSIASQENGSRSSQKSCNHAEDVGIAFGRIIETRSIDECDGATIEREGLRYLDDVGAGLKPSSNPKIRGASHVDKLSIRNLCQCTYGVAYLIRTVVFPLPVAPITLQRYQRMRCIANEVYLRDSDTRFIVNDQRLNIKYLNQL